jgi:hypothetical protein
MPPYIAHQDATVKLQPTALALTFNSSPIAVLSTKTGPVAPGLALSLGVLATLNTRSPLFISVLSVDLQWRQR